MLTKETVANTIGKNFADKLDETILFVSRDISYTRRQMIDDLGCANFQAAYRLQRVLKRLEIYTPAKLFRTDPMSLARAKGIGEAAIFVAMCILDFEKYDVAEWWGWNKTNTVKFSTLKSKAIKKASKRKHEV